MNQDQQLRAQIYQLLARLFINTPDEHLLSVLANLPVDETDTPLSRAWKGVSEAAKNTDQTQLKTEFQQLFIGLGRGEVLPFASYYLSGFLMEKPLALLRQDLQVLGFQRQAVNKEPEDHVSAICEVMAMLVLDENAAQKDFFQQHVEPWFLRFFNDLKQSKSAFFYKHVAELGTAFIQFEEADICRLG